MNIQNIALELWQRSPDGLLIVDENGMIVQANPQMEQLFGYAPGELTGRELSFLIPKAIRKQHALDVAQFFKSPVSRPMGLKLNLTGERKDGTTVPVEISLSPFRDEAGRPCVIAAARDVSYRRAMEDELRLQAKQLSETNEDLEQFAYVASHDLQEPLRMISSHLQIIRRQIAHHLDSEASKTIDYVVSEADRMRDIVRDVLAYSRMGMVADVTQVSCSTVVDQVSRRLSHAIEDARAKISVNMLPTIVANTSQMIVLFQNLIENAIKYRSDVPPHVSISADSAGELWQFAVSDNGIGIEKESFNRIFLMFRRLHDRGSYAGNGIGLALCKKIVERNGGKIWVESAPGRGSTFYFTWPKKLSVKGSRYEHDSRSVHDSVPSHDPGGDFAHQSHGAHETV